MINSLAFYISNIGGLCKKNKFPGTIASFVALIFSFLSYYFFDIKIYILLFFFFLLIAFWSIRKVQKSHGLGDHQWIGIDEWVGMWLANFFLYELNFSFREAIIFSIVSFLIFRLIDIVKFIPPINLINKKEKQGPIEIIFDDLLAGIYTYFLLLILLGIYNLDFFYSSFLILIPAMIANMAPTLFKTKRWSTPIDEKTFGKNKTWRGFIVAIIFGTLSFLFLVKINLAIYLDNINYLIFIGFLFSFGAIGGDLIKSFFKRKIGINSGESWVPWDQIDYVLGMIILTFPLYLYSYSQIIMLLIIGGTTSALIHRLGYLLKINSAKQ